MLSVRVTLDQAVAKWTAVLAQLRELKHRISVHSSYTNLRGLFLDMAHAYLVITNRCRSVRTLRYHSHGAEMSWVRNVLRPKCLDTISALAKEDSLSQTTATVSNGPSHHSSGRLLRLSNYVK